VFPEPRLKDTGYGGTPLSERKLGKNCKPGEKELMEKKKQSGIIRKEGEAMRTNDVESRLKKFETSQAELEELEKLEERYQRPLKRVPDRLTLVRLVSKILGKDGERELELLILENRVPIIVGDEGNWYEEWYPEGFASPVEDLLYEAGGIKSRIKECMTEDLSPEDLLRLCVARAAYGAENRLERLAQQLGDEGEYSFVIEGQIDVLVELNRDLPASPEELPEILD
jgi:hypothetical protein